MPINILFKVAGGYTIGMGHVFRSLTLAQCFLKRGQRVLGFLCNADETCIGEIHNQGYHVIESGLDALPLSDLTGKPPDAVILDTHISQARFLKEARAHWPKACIAVLDYNDFMEKNIDLVINLHNHNSRQFRPNDHRIEYLEGPRYAIFRPEFDDYIKAKHSPAVAVERITVCMGGSDVSGATANVLDALSNLINWRGGVDVVIGPAFKYNKSLLAATQNVPWKCNFHESPKNLVELMSRADLAFSGGGTTMLEFLALGIPTVVLSRTELEDNFSRRFEEQDSIARISSHNIKLQTVMETLLWIMKNTHKRLEMYRQMTQLVDCRGRDRIVTAVLSKIVR